MLSREQIRGIGEAFAMIRPADEGPEFETWKRCVQAVWGCSENLRYRNELLAWAGYPPIKLPGLTPANEDLNNGLE